MRKLPLRGEKYKLWPNGEEVTVVEVATKHFVKVILPDGKISAVPKTTLNLPTVNTKFYEKVPDDQP